jgi:hypothetical protein
MAADYLWGSSILLLSPKVSCAAISPLMALFSVITDLVLHHPPWLHSGVSPAVMMAAGMLVIFLGFVGVASNGCSTRQDARREARRDPQEVSAMIPSV